MESYIQVRVEEVTAAVNLFINRHNREISDLIWHEAKATTSPGFAIGRWWIVEPVTAEQRFQYLLEALEGIKKVPLEEYPFELDDPDWYDRAHELKKVLWLSVDATIWLPVSDVVMINDILVENELGKEDRL